MRRFLLVVLLLVLSLQSVWTAAANACTHEQTPTTAHFGHHEPHHATSGHDAAPDEGRGSLAQADHHHFLSGTPVPHVPSLPVLVTDGGSVVIHAVDPYPGIPRAALERPPKDLAELVSARSG